MANDLKLPILAIGSSPGILATGPWAFKIQATPTDIMGFLGKLASEKLGVKRVVLLHDQSSDGYIGQKNALADYFTKAGVTIAADEKFISSDLNFLALATKVATTPTDAIFIAAPAEVSANLILQIRQAGLQSKVEFIGPSTLGSAGFIKAGGKAVEGTYFVSDYSPNNPSPMNEAFVKAYRPSTRPRPTTGPAWATRWAGRGAGGEERRPEPRPHQDPRRAREAQQGADGAGQRHLERGRGAQPELRRRAAASEGREFVAVQ